MGDAVCSVLERMLRSNPSGMPEAEDGESSMLEAPAETPVTATHEKENKKWEDKLVQAGVKTGPEVALASS